ncbi:MAG: SMC-Scp complex subunit ScpB [Bacteroidetes bacterium]|nr:MAG: SMC-Scp complex subunit ScpB [Bacteroidota bacterium]
MEQLVQHIESLVFTADHPISVEEITSVLEESFGVKFPAEEIEAAIAQLRERYQAETYAFEICEIAGGYQFMTKGIYHHTVGVFLRQTTRKRLSRSALETLSIVAYKQPVSKPELEKIRGVSCDYAIQKLLEKELVVIVGRSDGPGKPLLYGTSEKFMDYFGLRSLEDLPTPKEFVTTANQIGELSPIEEEAEAAPPGEAAQEEE